MDVKWMLLLFADKKHVEILKPMWFLRVVDMAFVLDLPTQVVSNYYHGLIKPRGVLCYCEILKV